MAPRCASPAIIEAATKAANFLRRNLTAQGRLLRSWRGEAGSIAGFAEDYAFLIQGLLDLYEADWDSDWLKWALELQERQDALFRDETGAAISAARPGTRWFRFG